jgi:hypothetical protein
VDVIPRRSAALAELPLSALQQRRWYLCTSYPGTSSSVVCLVHRYRGPLDTGALVRAIGAVVDRHESLRTLFANRAGGPVQVIGPPVGLPVQRVDLTDLPAADREDRARALVAASRQALLDLETGPLVTACLLTLADDDHILSVNIHHILADGASLAILERELGAYYRAFTTGTDPDLPAIPLQYGDFAVWQASGHGPDEEEDLRYWRETLAGLPVLDLPADLPRPPEKGTRSAELRHQIEGDVVDRLDALARAERATLFMVVLAAFQALLARYSGEHDICVGTPFVGRTRPELVPVVGLLANLVALRGDLSGDPTFRELVARTRHLVLDALDHQEVPFGRVVAELGLPHDPGRTQVFQVFFALYEIADGLTLPGLRVEEFPVRAPQAIHDLSLDIWRSPQGLATMFRFDSALFHPATIEELARRYEQILRAVLDDPGARLSTLAPGWGAA